MAHTDTISTDDLIAIDVTVLDTSDMSYDQAEIAAEGTGWAREELVKRANAGDYQAKSYLGKERREAIKAEFGQRIKYTNNRIAVIADLAVDWNVPQNYVRRVLNQAGIRA